MNKKTLVSRIYWWLKAITIIMAIGLFGAMVVAYYGYNNLYVTIVAQTCYKLMIINLLLAWSVGRYKIMLEFQMKDKTGGL